VAGKVVTVVYRPGGGRSKTPHTWESVCVKIYMDKSTAENLEKVKTTLAELGPELKNCMTGEVAEEPWNRSASSRPTRT
jgi:hypothetical protein